MIKRFSVWSSNEIQKSDKTYYCFFFSVGALSVVSSVKFAFPVVSNHDSNSPKHSAIMKIAASASAVCGNADKKQNFNKMLWDYVRKAQEAEKL